jgi:hypothetical protein
MSRGLQRSVWTAGGWPQSGEEVYWVKTKKSDLPRKVSHAVAEKLIGFYRKKPSVEFPWKLPQKGYPHSDKSATVYDKLLKN